MPRKLTKVTTTLPDGVERPLTLDYGNQRLFIDRVGCSINEAVGKYKDAALAEALFCFLHRDGKPPMTAEGELTAEDVTGVQYTYDELITLWGLLQKALTISAPEKKDQPAAARAEAAPESQIPTNGLASGHSPTSTSELPVALPSAGSTPATSGA